VRAGALLSFKQLPNTAFLHVYQNCFVLAKSHEIQGLQGNTQLSGACGWVGRAGGSTFVFLQTFVHHSRSSLICDEVPACLLAGLQG